MTLPSWPGERSAPFSASERQLAAAGISLLLEAVVLAVWAAIGWAHIGQFSGAAERLFNTPPFADDDLAVAIPEFSYAVTLVVASALAIITAAFGGATLDRWHRSRTAVIILAVVLIAFSVKVLLLNFIAGIEVPDTGISDHLYRQSVHQFNALTPWRSGLWFDTFSAASGVVSIVLAVAACYLVRRSALSHHRHPMTRSS